MSGFAARPHRGGDTMKRLLVVVCALIWLVAATGPSQAGWDNVFQTTLFGRHRQTVVNNYYVSPPPVVASASPVSCCQQQPVVVQSPPPAPSPCQQCTTQYTQRCFYTPVTTYQT